MREDHLESHQRQPGGAIFFTFPQGVAHPEGIACAGRSLARSREAAE
jgi:hypothetical protein